MSAIQVGVQAGFVLRSVRAEGTVEFWFHATFMLQMSCQAGVVIVYLATVLARIGDFLAVKVAQRTRLWKIRKTEEINIRNGQQKDQRIHLSEQRFRVSRICQAS